MRGKPVSTFIVVVTRKNIKSRNAMSAIELAFISCIFFLLIAYSLGFALPPIYHSRYPEAPRAPRASLYR